jgi:hypothetical protein
MISTQPGSTPVASFKIVSLDEVEPYISYAAGNDCGQLLVLSSLHIIDDIISKMWGFHSHKHEDCGLWSSGL